QRTLRLLVTPFVAYVYGPGEVWSTPLKISEDSSPMTVYKPATTARLSSLAYLFVGGVDCKVSGWETRTTCSKPCGGGVRREARQILQQPSQGGQTCPAELAREIACNEQPCPIDCKLSPWKQVGKCSKPCDGGSLEQSRLIEEQPRYDGSPCSDVLDRKIACNVHACDGALYRFASLAKSSIKQERSDKFKRFAKRTQNCFGKGACLSRSAFREAYAADDSEHSEGSEDLARFHSEAAPGRERQGGGVPLTLAFSGGGVRALACEAGVLWRLAQAGRPGDVEHFVAVSGGAYLASALCSQIIAAWSPRGQEEKA
ncbi:unnamed protein product, partial [Polarella glacialis]